MISQIYFFTDHRLHIINFHQILFISSINVCVGINFYEISLYLKSYKNIFNIYIAIKSTNSCLTKSICIIFVRKHLWSNHYTSPAGVIYNEGNIVHSINVFEGKRDKLHLNLISCTPLNYLKLHFMELHS